MVNNCVVCLGELLIDFVPEENGRALADVGTFRKAAGGAPANVAAAVAKLGGTSRFIGKIGIDPFGTFLKRSLEEVGVHAAVVVSSEAKPLRFRPGEAAYPPTDRERRGNPAPHHGAVTQKQGPSWLHSTPRLRRAHQPLPGSFLKRCRTDQFRSCR
jgi:hypothetical protein